MPGHVYKRGVVYWIKFYDNGKAYYLSAKTDKEREAKTLLSYYLGQVARGEFKGFEDKPLSMKELFDNFEADCKRRKLRGVDIIGYHLKPVRAWFEAMRVDQVTELELDRYVNHRLGQGRKESTVNREMQYLLQSMRPCQAQKTHQGCTAL